MTVDVDVVDGAGLAVDHRTVGALVEAVLGEEGLHGDVDVAFVSEAAITDLNGRYRDAAGPTDVLSFDYSTEADWPGREHAGSAKGRNVSGEIVVCPRVVIRYASEEGRDVAEQLGWTLIHGALHLSGYDHETDTGEMRERERALLARLDEHVRALAPAAGA
jgi:probable rRNA maturation factor